jgi:hypothetical protein
MAIRKAREIREETLAGVYPFPCKLLSVVTAERMKGKSEQGLSRSWINVFLRRDEYLALRVLEYIEPQRALYRTTALLRRWLNDFKDILLSMNPSLVFNTDEIMLALPEGRTKVIIERSKTAFDAKHSL